jgi:hypothetical protein
MQIERLRLLEARVGFVYAEPLQMAEANPRPPALCSFPQIDAIVPTAIPPFPRCTRSGQICSSQIWRRGWDLNPRMEVLQTSPLDLLGTAPQSNEYSETRVPLLVAAPGGEIYSCRRELPQKRGLKSR